jgi:hypothetical protein
MNDLMKVFEPVLKPTKLVSGENNVKSRSHCPVCAGSKSGK